MERVVLGKTGLHVGKLGLGGLFLSDLGGNDAASAAPVLRRAVELGIGYVDTAPAYGDSERLIGAALAQTGADLVVSTKLGGRPQPFEPKDRSALLASVEESLRLLGRDRIDILFVHVPDRPGQYAWWDDAARFHGPVTDALAALKDRGLVRFTGLGGTTAYELARIVEVADYDVVLTAFNYSLLWTEAAIAVLPAAAARGMGVVAGSPLQGGALAQRHDAEVAHGAEWLSPPRRQQLRRLYKLLDDLELPIDEVALRFVVSNPLVDVVLTGARSVEDLERSAAAVERGPLADDVLARLAEIQALVPFRPYEEPSVLPFGRAYAGPGPLR